LKRCHGFFDLSAALGLSLAKAGPHPIDKRGICQARMSAVERWTRIIFNRELHRTRSFLASNLGNKPQPKVDAGGYATSGNDLAVDHDTFVNWNRSKGLEEFHCHPVRCRAAPLQQPCGTEN
jgi:hypothetical protein